MIALIDAFLRGLDTAATVTSDNGMSSEQVNRLGEILGISSGQIVELIERLKPNLFCSRQRHRFSDRGSNIWPFRRSHNLVPNEDDLQP
jgi:hypothetical protein